MINLFFCAFQLLHHNVDAVERKPDSQAGGGSLIIKCKDFRIIQLDIKEQREFLNIASSIEKLSNIGEDFLKMNPEAHVYLSDLEGN